VGKKQFLDMGTEKCGKGPAGPQNNPTGFSVRSVILGKLLRSNAISASPDELIVT